MELETQMSNFVLKHPFTCIISGPTSSGKTVLVRRILKHFKQTMLFKFPVSKLKVIYCYGQYQKDFDEPIASNVSIQYNEGLMTKNEILSTSPHLVIIDDLMTELADNKELADLFTKGSHHNNLSVIFIVQNLFVQGRQMRTVGLNSHYYFLMKNPRDKLQIKRFAIQTYPGETEYFMEAYKDATSKQFGYIKIDLTQTTEEAYRVTACFTPEETNNVFSPVVYLKNKKHG